MAHNKKNIHQNITIKGTPSVPIKTSKKGNLGLTHHSWKWEWSYVFKNRGIFDDNLRKIIGKCEGVTEVNSYFLS